MGKRGIDQFKSQVDKLGGFAVTNLFRVTVYFPKDFFNGGKYDKGSKRKSMQYLCRQVTIPTSNITPIDIPFRGMIYKIPGDRVYEPLTLTFMNDNRQMTRNHFLDWHKWIRARDNNYMRNRDRDNVHGFGDVKVEIMSKTNLKNGKGKDTYSADVSSIYYFHEAWPTLVSAMELDWASNDAIQEFTVQFEYQNYELKNDSRVDTNHFRTS